MQGEYGDIFTASKYIKDIVSTIEKNISKQDEECNLIFKHSEIIPKKT